LWYLAEGGMRCRTRGNSCFRRLFGILCIGLKHYKKYKIRNKK
jgi:hypothetical protein